MSILIPPPGVRKRHLEPVTLPLREVNVTGRWLQRPIAPCEILKHGLPGVLLIDGVPYLALLHAELPPPPAEPLIRGLQLTKPDGTSYDLDLTGTIPECDCPDATFRPERPGGCRHVVAYLQAQQKGGVR